MYINKFKYIYIYTHIQLIFYEIVFQAIEMLKSSVGMATLIFERYGYQCQQRQFSSQMSSFDGVRLLALRM